MHLTGLVLDSVRNHNLIMTFLTQVHTTIFQPLSGTESEHLSSEAHCLAMWRQNSFRLKEIPEP
jgi:hypothetical protein